VVISVNDLGTDANKSYLEHAPWLIAIFTQKKGGDNERAYTQAT